MEKDTLKTSMYKLLSKYSLDDITDLHLYYLLSYEFYHEKLFKLIRNDKKIIELYRKNKHLFGEVIHLEILLTICDTDRYTGKKIYVQDKNFIKEKYHQYLNTLLSI